MDLMDLKMFCYIVCIDNGFYMEPDIEIIKVFLNYKDAKKFLYKLSKNNKQVFIVKKRLYL